MLHHAEARTATTEHEPTPRREAPAAATPPAGDALIAHRPAELHAGDQLAGVLRSAVAARSAGPGQSGFARLQRFYDPATVPDDLNAAATYVWGQGGAIVRAYLAGAWNIPVADEDVTSTLARAFESLIPAQYGPQQRGPMNHWKKRIAADLTAAATTNRAPLLAQNVAGVRAVLRCAVQALNVLEQDTETERVLEATNLATDVRVGTEFTFTNDTIKKTDPGVSDDDAKAMVVRWRQLVEADKTLVPAVKSKKGKADKGSEQNAVKFTYDLGGGQTWWWALDIDPGCLETQTAPATKTQLAEVQHIINSHIFGKLATLGLRVDPTDEGGGGHLSFDKATLFGTSAELLLEVVAQLQNEAASWSEHFEYTDAPNSPWFADQGIEGNDRKGEALKEFARLAAELQEGLVSGKLAPDDVAERVKSFHDRVINRWATDTQAKQAPKKGSMSGSAFASLLNAHEEEQKRAANVLAHPAHYQAVNVEHLVASTKPSRRRIELRAIGAQTNYNRLIEDISYIYRRIEVAREKVTQSVGARRQQFTGS